MAKITLADIANLQNEQTVTASINANSALIEAAIEKTLSRDGSIPNQMTANLDMNSRRILNLITPMSPEEPLRVQDLHDFLGSGLTLNVITNSEVKVTDTGYGAIGNGVANDTVAVQAALNSGNKRIIVPPGKICLVSAITIPANVTLIIQEGAEIKKFGTANTVLVTFGGDNATLLGPGKVNMNSVATGNVTVFGNGVDNIRIEGVTIANSVSHGLYSQDCTDWIIRGNKFINGTLEFAACILYALAQDNNNTVIEDNYFDCTGAAQNAIYGVPQGFKINRLIIRNNTFVANSGDVDADEHSAIVLLQNSSLPDVYFEDCVITGNVCTNFNFPYSLTGMKACTISNNIAKNGGTSGYCFEFANNIDCTYTGNYGEGSYSVSGNIFVLNNAYNCTLSGNVAVSSWANASAVAIAALNGSKNIIANNTIKVAGGVGLSITGNDYVVSGNMFDGASAGSIAINLNTGLRRTVVNNITKDWTSTPIANIDATDTLFGNSTLGAVFTGSISGITGAEIRLNGGANSENSISTIGTGTPTIFSEHRGTSNTGNFAWRNGTGAANTQMILSSVGALSVTGNVTSTGTGIGYATGAGGTVTQATNKSTGVTLNKASGNVVMNNAALNAGVSVAFTLTNSTIAATDTVIVNIKSGATANSYTVSVDAVAAGSCNISLRNYTGGNLSEAVVISFNVIKGVAA